MTKIWLASATSFRTLNGAPAPRPLPAQDGLQRRMDRFGSRSDMGRSGAVNAPPQALDAQLIEDGAAL